MNPEAAEWQCLQSLIPSILNDSTSKCTTIICANMNENFFFFDLSPLHPNLKSHFFLSLIISTSIGLIFTCIKSIVPALFNNKTCISLPTWQTYFMIQNVVRDYCLYVEFIRWSSRLHSFGLAIKKESMKVIEKVNKILRLELEVSKRKTI